MIDIKRALELHKLWLSGHLALSGQPGVKLPDLSEANLREADLSYANLTGADLSYANLSEANLSYANLSRARGIILLPVQDYRGYSWAHAIQTDDGWRIRAGCRFFTLQEAREHWGQGYAEDRELGDMYLHACDWLERKLAKLEVSDGRI